MLLFLCNFVSSVWVDFVCLLFIALWKPRNYKSVSIKKVIYCKHCCHCICNFRQHSVYKIRIHPKCSALSQSCKKTLSTIIKCLYKFYLQSILVLECLNVPLKGCIWNKYPSKELNQNMLESQLLPAQVSLGVISLPPSGVLFRQNLSISLTFLNTESPVPHIMWILCAHKINPKQLLKPLQR